MKNRLTFVNVIGILLDNKKKTYSQHQLIRNLFSVSLQDGEDFEITDADASKYSYWCSGTRPIPMDIVHTYEEDDNFVFMEEDFKEKIIPNLLNVPNARSEMEILIHDSRSTIGDNYANELLSISSTSNFFTEIVRYAILSDHGNNSLYSPDLSDILLNGRVPSTTKEFLGRKTELKELAKLFQEHSLVFVTGIAGIGKSEFAKEYANKNKKKYTNILFMHYEGNLKKCIASLEYAEDSVKMSEEELFETHMKILKKMHADSLLIIDNFNVLPKDDAYFKELIKLDFQILITTRCKVTQFQTVHLNELDSEKELSTLFCNYCPASIDVPETVAEIISELRGHTLSVCLAALSLSASGIEPEELLYELKSCGLNISSGESVELYKDEEFSEALMIEHLRKLLQLNQLSTDQLDILRNLSLLPASGVSKASIKKWLQLSNLNDVNHMIRYGFIMDDSENKKISLHPLIQYVAVIETLPSVSNCRTMLDSLHLICLTHGLEVRRPDNVINSLISINEHIINDEPDYYLLYLQDMFPYFDKYLIMDYLPKLVERISYEMDCHQLNSPCDKALLLDYKAELFVLKKDYSNALKKRTKAMELLIPLLTADADKRTANLISNLYNNTSNVYLLMKKGKEAITNLKQAFQIRKEYGIFETHDSLQQMMNMTNILILAKEYTQAEQLLEFYENIVLETESKTSFDYGICQLGKGIVALATNDPVHSETYLLNAEKLISDAIGADNEYSKTAYRYLYSLYSRWHKNDRALEYKDKILGLRLS